MFQYLKKLLNKLAHRIWCPDIDDIDIRATICPECASKVGMGGRD